MPSVRVFVLKVWISCAVENVLISSRNWPLRLTPGMFPLPAPIDEEDAADDAAAGADLHAQVERGR